MIENAKYDIGAYVMVVGRHEEGFEEDMLAKITKATVATYGAEMGACCD